mmetsp:Transcript_43200/g.105709  ORF Transcript_43200/g.105709 Transcript_43200/m.105709 type:complete len:101 (-) Transcript_43200:9-311(-)
MVPICARAHRVDAGEGSALWGTRRCLLLQRVCGMFPVGMFSLPRVWGCHWGVPPSAPGDAYWCLDVLCVRVLGGLLGVAAFLASDAARVLVIVCKLAFSQ